MTDFLLLEAFRALFDGVIYRPRSSTKGDQVASYLFEDLFHLGRSAKYNQRVTNREVVVNTGNTIQGKKGRRGDGTLGEIVPRVIPSTEVGFSVARGPLAKLQIGSEAKTLATKMIAQIDRVMNDLDGQAKTFKKHSRDAITVGIIGVNHADAFTSALGDNFFDAKQPPSKESAEVIRRLNQFVDPHYDELIILPFKATNRAPFRFEWVNETKTRNDYASALIRIATEYEDRF